MPDEKECYNLLREMRWSDGVRCVYCGSEHVVRTGRWRDTPNQRYHCRSCDKWFNDKTGTIFQDTRLPLRVWFSLRLCCSSR
ncbi:MAG: transposase [Methanothrix sp.]|uniref:transposase n=1 Tax=Methanothrix sp. TaxID=90426 RepID=UPI003C741F2B